MRMLIVAAWVWTGEALLRDAEVLVDGGRVVAVGEVECEAAEVVELGESLLMPGLVNAHTHLELTGLGCEARADGATFTDWIVGLQRRRMGAGAPEETIPAAVAAGIEQCLRYGVTAVGDISQQMELTRPVIARSPLRCVSYGEVLGLGARRGRFDELLPRAIDRRDDGGRLRVGLSPHAPYTVDLPGYRECLRAAREMGLPLATHLAETPDERDFLERQAGAFRALWERFGSWADRVETYRGGPIEFAQAIGLLEYPTLLAHVNYCSDAELAILARGRASVVYCPRTHAYFGHPPHRFREMLAAGINVAVGTDSCASSPDLDLMAELRLIHARHPDVPAETLFRMATVKAALAIGMGDVVGSIRPGVVADLVAFPVGTATPLLHLLEADVRPTHVWIDGGLIRGPSSARS